MSRKKYQYNDKIFGSRLRTIRESMGLSVVKFSDLLGISQSSLSAIENNKTIPSAQVVINLCQNADLDINWLLTGEGEFNQNRDEKEDTGNNDSMVGEWDPQFDLQGGWKPRSIEEFAGVEEGFGFKEAVGKLSEIYRSGDKNLIHSIAANLDASAPSGVDTEIAELLMMARMVLISKTEYAHSLSANIRSFHHSVEVEQRLDKVEGEIAIINTRLHADRRQGDRRKANPDLYNGIERRILPDRRGDQNGGGHPEAD